MTETFHAGPGLGRLSDVTIIHGDCIEAMAELAADSVDAIVTDPPYGLGFMGKAWDAFAPQNTTAQRSNAGGFGDDETKPWNKARSGTKGVRTTFRCRSCNGWSGSFSEARAARQKECKCDSPDLNYAGAPPQTVAFGKWCELWTVEALRVLKPGGHLLAFGGMRTQHRLIVAIEDAGFEIRDAISWIFGSGFPKSHNVSDALDRIVPLGARCVCAQRSSQTIPDSPAGYLSSRDSDGEQLRNASGGDPESAPSRADVLARSHDGQRSDAPASESASTSLDGEIDRHANASSRGQASHPSEVDRPSASARSGTQTSTLDAPASAPRRTAAHTRHTDGSAFDSARYQHMACATCGGIDIPQGLGTALKPATEIICVARKPLVGTVAANVLAHGTGALNIDGCRIGTDAMVREAGRQGIPSGHVNGSGGSAVWSGSGKEQKWLPRQETVGRWPANVVLDADQAAALDEQSGIARPKAKRTGRKGGCSDNGTLTGYGTADDVGTWPADPGGGASRFFYVAKAPKKERPVVIDADGKSHSHATVKPLALMRWLVRLVTPPGGICLDPFAGSGTTVEAALLEDFRVIGIEREADYLPMIQQRIARCLNS